MYVASEGLAPFSARKSLSARPLNQVCLFEADVFLLFHKEQVNFSYKVRILVKRISPPPPLFFLFFSGLIYSKNI